MKSANISPRCAPAVDLPVNADFEGGFARKPREGSPSTSHARSKDRRCRVCRSRIPPETPQNSAFTKRAFAIERIKAARRAAIDADKQRSYCWPAACEGLSGRADRPEHGDRSAAGLCGKAGRGLPLRAGHQDQGSRYQPSVTAVHPKPVNLLIGASGLSVGGKPPISASAASASAVRWRARVGRLHACGRGEIAEEGPRSASWATAIRAAKLNKMFS